MYGLEDVGGFGRALAVYLTEQNCLVKEVNTRLSHKWRRSRNTVEKHDSLDAEYIARVVKDEMDRLPDAKPLDHYWAIGQLVKQRAGLQSHYSANLRRLHQQISYHYPSYKQFFSQVDGKTALAFWEHYPSPQCLAEVSEVELADFLKEVSNNYLSLPKARQIKQLTVEDGNTICGYQNSRDVLVRSLVQTLRTTSQEMDMLEAELTVLMKDLVCTLDTMPGIDLVAAASFIAEIGPIERFASAEKLARFAGIAPVVNGSGGKHNNYKSEQGNRILHDLFKQLAVRQLVTAKNTKRPRNAYLLAYYEQKRAAGKSKRQAIVCLMRKLVNVVYFLLKNKAIYSMPDVPVEKAG